MEFREVVNQRRSLRSFAPVEVSEAVIKDLAAVAGLAPSCSNKQPWRFVFVRSPAMLERMFATLAPGNANWAKQASLIVAVWSQADLDCRTPDGRDYYQFDTGMASALLMLAATEKNLTSPSDCRIRSSGGSAGIGAARGRPGDHPHHRGRPRAGDLARAGGLAGEGREGASRPACPLRLSPASCSRIVAKRHSPCAIQDTQNVRG
jgi:hypothetical protein